MWTRISDFIQLSQKTVLIDGLHPQSWYHLQITAFSEAGASEAEYSVLTRAVEERKCFFYSSRSH